MPPTVAPELKEEMLYGGSDVFNAALQTIRRVLPQYIDDLTRANGPELYDRMLRDGDVNSAFETWKLSVMAEGIHLEPSHKMPQIPTGADPKVIADAEHSKELTEFVESCFKNAEYSVHDAALNLLDGRAIGNKLAEIVLDDGSGKHAGRLVLKSLKPKPSRFVRYVVDDHGTLLGYLAVGPNQSPTSLTLDDLPSVPGFMPTYKCLVYTNNPNDGSPQGRAVLNTCYLPWFMKTQVLPEFFKYLKQFATPAIIGKTAPDRQLEIKEDANGQPIDDGNGGYVMESAERKLLTALLGWLNAIAIAVPNGTEIQLVESKGDGAAYNHALEYFGRQIHEAILGTAQSTKEAQHESKSSKTVGQDVVGLRVADGRRRIGELLTKLAKLLIQVNFGDDDAELFCPTVTVATVEAQDAPEMIDSLSRAFANGFLHDTQLPEIYSMLGWPQPDWDQVKAEKQARADLMAQSVSQTGTLFNPAGA